MVPRFWRWPRVRTLRRQGCTSVCGSQAASSSWGQSPEATNGEGPSTHSHARGVPPTTPRTDRHLAGSPAGAHRVHATALCACALSRRVLSSHPQQWPTTRCHSKQGPLGSTSSHASCPVISAHSVQPASFQAQRAAGHRGRLCICRFLSAKRKTRTPCPVPAWSPPRLS